MGSTRYVFLHQYCSYGVSDDTFQLVYVYQFDMSSWVLCVQTLKVLRYLSKLLIATGLPRDNMEIMNGLKSIDSSLGTSRKAYRIGKFLQNVVALKKVPLRAPHAFLEVTVNIGEGIYYFTDQFQWYAI